jgi:competence protein ComEA
MRIVGLIALALLVPSFVLASTLVNINTADAALLDTLPGIGPSKAVAIVDYRTQHGPFARIEDIQNVSGIGASTFAEIQPFITVGDAAPSASTTPLVSASSTASSGSGSASYVAPPSAITIRVQGAAQALLNVPYALSARVTDKNGTLDSIAHIVWSFGDGSSGEGNTIEKTYRYPGTYLVVVTARDGDAVAEDDLSVTVLPAQVRMTAVSGEGITLTNESDSRLDLSLWRLVADTGSFRMPLGTMLLPHASVLFASAVTNLPVSLEAMLLFPDGRIATRFAPAVAQPFVPAARSISVQEVEPIIRTSVNTQAHEETVVAPAAVPEPGTAAGAVVPPQPAAAAKASPNIFRSPWTYGLLGILTMAGGAFILL